MKTKILRSTKHDRRFRPDAGHARECGFTLIELMIAVSVLAVGMLGTIIMMIAGMQTDSRNKTDTTATVLDQEVIELYSTLKTYPRPTFVTINDCAPAASAHEADLGQGAAPAGNGALLYTAGTALTAAQIGDVDWTQPAPAFATAATPGYAMNYQTCTGDIYEVRWNVMDLTPAGGTNGRLSLLTVSSRQKSAVDASAGLAQNRAVLYAQPVTLRSMIEN